MRDFRFVKYFFFLLTFSFLLLFVNTLFLPKDFAQGTLLKDSMEGSSLPQLQKELLEQEAKGELSSLRTLFFASQKEQETVDDYDFIEEISFLGKNERPDRKSEGLIFLQLRSDGKCFEHHLGNRLYLCFDPFSFSVQETPAWIEFVEEEAPVQALRANLFYQEPGQEYEQEARKIHSFTLYQTNSYLQPQIDGLQIDNSFLLRQGLKWYGKDLFLIEHGGDLAQQERDKERLIFRLQDKTYAESLALGQCLRYLDNKWQLQESSEGLALLELLEVEEEALKLRIWGSFGPASSVLRLNRSEEVILMPQFEWKGFRKHFQFVFQLNNKKEVFEAKDWFVFTDRSFVKLESSEKIDAYIQGNLEGELLVVDGIETVDGKEQIVLHGFSKHRSQRMERRLEMTRWEEKKDEKTRRKSVQKVLNLGSAKKKLFNLGLGSNT